MLILIIELKHEEKSIQQLAKFPNKIMEFFVRSLLTLLLLQDTSEIVSINQKINNRRAKLAGLLICLDTVVFKQVFFRRKRNLGSEPALNGKSLSPFQLFFYIKFVHDLG